MKVSDCDPWRFEEMINLKQSFASVSLLIHTNYLDLIVIYLFFLFNVIARDEQEFVRNCRLLLSNENALRKQVTCNYPTFKQQRTTLSKSVMRFSTSHTVTLQIAISVSIKLSNIVQIKH